MSRNQTTKCLPTTFYSPKIISASGRGQTPFLVVWITPLPVPGEILMNIFSGFDGMSCGQIAVNRAGIKYNKYFASEIDKYAIQVTQKNYPNTIQLGDITNIQGGGLPKIDLAIAGSPCQGFSIAGKGLAFNDPRSKLFFEFVRLLEEFKAINPDIKFLLENVRMKKEYRDIISKYLGVEPIEINSSILSAQNRRRLYWTNIPLEKMPKDKGLLLQDILLTEGIGIIRNRNEYFERNQKAMGIVSSYYKGADNHGMRTLVYLTKEQVERAKESFSEKLFHTGNKRGNMKFPGAINKKSRCLVATTIKGSRNTIHIKDGDSIRILYPVECERLQTVPDNYTDSVSDTQRYRMLGNGWTIDIISYLLKNVA